MYTESFKAEEPKSIISLRDYLEKGKTFLIPDYQRGYIWGKENSKYTLNSVLHLLQSLDNVIEVDGKKLFLQGVTVIEQDDQIIVIDGQQRTTCLFITLRMLGYTGRFNINYAIRTDSDNELKKISPEYNCSENGGEEYQDIYFFKKTARLVQKHFKGKENQFKTICKRILDGVRFLYIDIRDPEQQSIIFSMMNGNKAVMKDEEIIKADLLRIASLTPKRRESDSDFNNDYENDILRSRYAREWDKWLYWWNRTDVKQLFETEGRMLGWLLPLYYCEQENVALTQESSELGYEKFRKASLADENFKTAKDVFSKIRQLQKRFEDVYHNPICYNYVGAIMKLCEKAQRLSFLRWYFQQDDLLKKEKVDELQRYYKWCFLGHTHKEIVEKHFQMERYESIREVLLKDFVYTGPKAYYVATKWLLMQNIDQDCKQREEGIEGRKFDFAIWNNKSLEHILPKSRVSHYDPNDPRIILGGDEKSHPEDSYLCRREDFSSGITEHSIGNLVLLYGRDNSSFGNLGFEDKKKKFFALDNENIFKSRHLIHTISVFAYSTWNKNSIEENQKLTRFNLEKYYETFFPVTNQSKDEN